MPYITNDKPVKSIIEALRARQITAAQAREQIRAIPPDPGKPFAYLDWEIEEAIKAGLNN
ncbi:MAG: hypothetical protein VW405_12675 [Rhodospirillaceae bacterium]